MFHAEIEPFPSAVYASHFPNCQNYGDITQFKSWPDHAIQLLVGGTPCQSFSVAGLRKGLDDPRGNLALVFLAIVDRYRPTWILWENVPGVHSSWSDEKVSAPSEESRRLIRADGLDPEDFEQVEQSSDFDCFLSGLEQLGYGVATTVLDAQFFGLAQRRERVFVVGHSGGQWQRSAAVLFDSSCLRGDSAPSREKGEGTTHSLAPCIGASGRGFERTGDTRGQDAVVASPLMYGSGNPSGHNARSVRCKDSHIIAHALSSEAFDAKGPSSDGDGLSLVPVAFQPRIARNGRGDMGDKVNALNSQSGESGKGDAAPCVAFNQNQRAEVTTNETSGSLNKGGGKPGQGYPAIQQGYAVRRLTTTECERLMGFPDGWTDITFNGKSASDGPRYRALGNSMAVLVLRWLGERIKAVDNLEPTPTLTPPLPIP